MRLRSALVALLAGGLLTGCGVKAADLFIVERTGSTPGARLTLLVSEEGDVTCNGGPMRKLSDSQLVQARAIQEELAAAAGEHRVLPARPGSVLAYRVREEAGSVSFADDSPGQSAAMHQLALFVLQTAQRVCHLSE